ncbi:MAG: hypothetical protein ABW079_17730 [Sedimenticola sp.]
MNNKSVNCSVSQLKELYDEEELAILFDWLGSQRPAELRDIDIQSRSGTTDQADEGIRLIPRMSGDYGVNTLSNAVARLALSKIQGELPQWAAIHANGQVEFARAATPKRHAKVDLMPRFLFEINWADTAPGFSWPEAYYLVYLPGFDCYVVTASQDSDEMHGYTDEAIGWFPAKVPVEEGVRRQIIAWWQGQADGWGQFQWEYLFRTGDVDTETAEAWANEVWDPDSGEPLPAPGACDGLTD